MILYIELKGALEGSKIIHKTLEVNNLGRHDLRKIMIIKNPSLVF